MPSEAHLKQLVMDARNGRLPPAVDEIRLPEEKTRFPKLLALDCNQWVALGRVHYGKSAEPGAVRALKEVRSAIADGRLIVALHFINAIEVIQREDPGSRERLAKFMVELSGNWFFRRFFDIEQAETRAAVRQVFPVLGAGSSTVRAMLLGYGLPSVFDTHLHALDGVLKVYGMKEMMERWLRSPENTIDYLAHSVRGSSTATDSRALEERGAREIQATRDTDAGLSPPDRIRLELTNQWNGRTGELVRRALSELGYDTEMFREWLTSRDNLGQFWQRIPSVHVPLMLEVASAKNRLRKIAANDLRDTSFYSATLPYANIIVTEKYWADRIHQAKLAAFYETHVLRRAADLHDALVAEGCA